MTTASEESPAIPLDYAKARSPWKRAWSRMRDEWSRLRAESHEHFKDAWKSIGYFLATATYLAGGPKQIILAFGLAFLTGGFGLAIETSQSAAHFWMWIGGFLIGLVIPLSKPKK